MVLGQARAVFLFFVLIQHVNGETLVSGEGDGEICSQSASLLSRRSEVIVNNNGESGNLDPPPLGLKQLQSKVKHVALNNEAARFKRSTAKTIEGVAVHNHKEGTQDWIIVFKKGTTEAMIKEICGGKCTFTGHLVHFATVHGDEETVASVLRGHSHVAQLVEPETTDYAIPEVQVAGVTQGSATWGLNAIGASTKDATGKGVHVYIQDTGIRVTHSVFGTRAKAAFDMTMASGGIFCDESPGACGCGLDVHGHGTHCAGTAAGQTYGVAPEANVYSVKTLTDKGWGYRSWQYGGIDYVTTSGGRPAVLSMSLGGLGADPGYTSTIDEAVDAGVTVVVAAGNSNSNACGYSPAFTPFAITVGATTSASARALYSNYGECLDIFAPGSLVMSASGDSDDGLRGRSGTSMACPHVAGAAALMLEKNSSWKSPQIVAALKNAGKTGTISGLKANDPSEFLWVGA